MADGQVFYGCTEDAVDGVGGGGAGGSGGH